eukprot:TRINITY_DN16744_c0_g1_i2.p2 TRINITY_DN16744_c0_g1~~TRINITY_DN16744_c0_g1_i2.p2  ORF type:complete len:201 (+),score=39.72 TRINITY_DN16744_c0_g1_i2:93-695(+)
MIRQPPRSTHCISSAASDVYKRQVSTQSTWVEIYFQNIISKQNNKRKTKLMIMYQQDKKSLFKKIEKIFLFLTYISAVCCLIKVDYNFAFSIFGYFLWVTKNESQIINLLLISSLIFTSLDLLWLFSTAQLWGSNVSGNSNWESFQSLHDLAIILTIILMIIKTMLFYFIYQFKATQDILPAKPQLEEKIVNTKQKLLLL